MRESSDDAGLLGLALLSLVVGAAAGLVGAIFRLALEHADRLRHGLIAWAHGQRLVGLFLVVVACGAAALTAAWLVRRFSPHASGSGIPHVEAVLNEEIPPAPARLIPVKFAGGLLAIGAGLALGREGPSVQMGASIAHVVGQFSGRSWADCRVLLASGAGASLAAAFNAPMAGAVFVLEELVRRFELRIAMAALAASTTAIAVARALLGDAPDYQVRPLEYASTATIPLFLGLGVVAGVAAIAYNRAILGTIAAFERFPRVSSEWRAGLIGAAVGALAWLAPGLVGGGDALTQRSLDGSETLALLPLVFLLRFGLGAVSYAAGTPGGLFAPMLVLGAQLGLCLGLLFRLVLPAVPLQPEGWGRGRDGLLLHRRGARAAHRDRPRHRDDGQRDDAAPHARRVLRGHAGAHTAERPTHLRFTARADPAPRTPGPGSPEMTERQISRISLAAERDSLPPLLAFVREATRRLGLPAPDVDGLERAVEEVCLNVLEQGLAEDATASFDVILLRRPGHIVVAIEDRGLPYDFLTLQTASLTSHADAVRFINLGTHGNRVEIVKRLSFEPIEAFIATGKAAPVAEASAEPVTAPVTLRLMTPDDAIAVARCTYAVYGYTLPDEYLYFPDRMREMLAGGLLEVCIGTTSDGLRLRRRRHGTSSLGTPSLSRAGAPAADACQRAKRRRRRR